MKSTLTILCLLKCENCVGQWRNSCGQRVAKTLRAGKPYRTLAAPIFMLCVSLRAQVPMPLVVQASNSPDTNTITLQASWQAVSNAVSYRLAEWAYQSSLTNLFTTVATNYVVAGLSETNADYGFAVACSGTNGLWSTNSLPVYWGTPNHHTYAMGYQTLNLLNPSLWNAPVFQTNFTDPTFQQLFFRAVAVNTTNWFAP